MKNVTMLTSVCPKCGKPYTGHPALSREDNATLICPECGTREALAAMGLPADEVESILDVIRKHSAL